MSSRETARKTGIARWVAPLVVAAVLTVPATTQAAVDPVLSGSVSDATTLPNVDSVAVAGSYAYVTDYFAGRLGAIDISLPSSPFIAGSSASSSTLMNGDTVNIAGGYAFVAAKNRNGPKGSEENDNGSGNSLTILDIHTDPAEPKIVGSVHDSETLFGAYGIAVSGNYAYVASQGCVSGQPCPDHSVGNALDVIEITGPGAPKIVATLRGGPEPKAYAHITAVAISGNYAYLTAFNQSRLTVVDISNPLSPTFVTTLADATHFPFPADVAISGNYAYVINQASKGPLVAVDISNPAEPKIVGSLSSTELSGGYRIRLRGKMAYVSASANAGIAVTDISNPLSPRLLASYVDPEHLHFTTGLDLDPSGRYVVATSTFLPTQHQPIYPPYALEPEGPEMDGTVSVIDLDPEPVEASISAESEPANPTASTSASFDFSVNDAVATVQCRLDAGPWTLCTTPTSQVYTQLNGGAHEFQVQATDSAGNTSTAIYGWTVTTPPANTTPPSAAAPGSGGGSGGGVSGGLGNGSENVLGAHGGVPNTAQIRAALLGVLLPVGTAGRIASVRKHRGYQLTFNAPSGGSLSTAWYVLPRAAHLKGVKPVLVADGRATFKTNGKVKLTLALSARGKGLLARAGQLKLTGRAVFTPTGEGSVTVTKLFTLR